jgi:hypothetical protein
MKTFKWVLAASGGFFVLYGSVFYSTPYPVLIGVACLMYLAYIHYTDNDK